MKGLCFLTLMLTLPWSIWAEIQQPEGLILYEKPGSTVLVVDKTACSVSVFQKQNHWQEIESYQCTTGKKQGPKQYEGDLKTPTGLYYLVDSWSGKELIRQYGPSAKIYGAGAFALNYPNYLDDVLYDKNGYGIWIHGTDKPFPDATRGCISTTNDDFLKVARHITLEETPVLIEESINYHTEKEVEQSRKRVLNFLAQWEQAWESDNTESYLDFYSKSFKTKKFNYRKWRWYKGVVNQKNKDREIVLKNISILKADGIYNIRFTQHYSSSKTKDIGQKTLYVVQEKEGLKIISEIWEPLNSNKFISQLK